VKAKKSFTQEQEKWLELIKRHLITNLLIEKDDLDFLPIFTREGLTYERLEEMFNGKLEQILEEINEAVLT